MTRHDSATHVDISAPPGDADDDRPRMNGMSRRSVAAAAVWSVPVIAVAVASPAHATSIQSTLTVDIVKAELVAGGVGLSNVSDVVVTVLDSQGRPWAGQPVTLTVTPIGAALGATAGVTGSDGRFTTTLTASALVALGVVTVVATSDVLTASDTATIVEPTPASLRFTQVTVAPTAGWTGPDPSGRMITAPGRNMAVRLAVNNRGGTAQTGYIVSVTLTHATLAARPVPTSTAATFTFTGSTDSVSGGQNRRTYTYSTSQVLGPNVTHTVDLAWTNANNAAIRALPLINATDFATSGSATLRYPDSTLVGTNTLRTGGTGSDPVNWIIRTTA